ncbi:MAG: hypothetical protein GY869_12575, partial [Planctomycetes bacterium]|nr:hypothetical protein [Planctomycetota bacterium]
EGGSTFYDRKIHFDKLGKYVCYQDKLLRKYDSYALTFEDSSYSTARKITILCLIDCQQVRDRLIDIDRMREDG